MQLPKISHPITKVQTYVAKKNVQLRPMLVKEEKILLTAKAATLQNESFQDMLQAIKQIVTNCIVDKNFDVDRLCLADLQYLFIKIRSISINNIVNISYTDPDDGEKYDFAINLDNVIVKMPEKQNKLIKVTDTIGIQMKYPEASLYDDKEYFQSEDQDEVVYNCVEKIFDGDSVIQIKKENKEELKKWFEELPISSYEKIQEFFMDLPTLFYEIKYKNSLGNEKVITLRKLDDFFTLL